jgi:hypothetical protein
MSTPQVAAQQLAGTALAPIGSQLVLAEWTAQGSTADEPLYQAPLHKHPVDEAWYALEGTLAIRAGEHDHHISAGGCSDRARRDRAHLLEPAPRPGPLRAHHGSAHLCAHPGHPRHR